MKLGDENNQIEDAANVKPHIIIIQVFGEGGKLK